MTGPQGMGPLMPVGLGEYDAAIMTMGPLFFVVPGPNLPTYSAWETFADAAANDIAIEPNQGFVYFRAWLAESGNAIDVYDTATATLGGIVFEVVPGSSLPTYSAWESRSTVYSTDLSTEPQQGHVYIRAWHAESGLGGNYNDYLDDTEMGTIVRIEDNVT